MIQQYWLVVKLKVLDTCQLGILSKYLVSCSRCCDIEWIDEQTKSGLYADTLVTG